MGNPQIHLVPVKMQHKLALQRGKPQLQEMLGVKIPEGWPQFPEAFEVREEGAEASGRWPSYFFVCPEEGAVVGNGGFAAPPDDAGEVEIGYEMAPCFQNKGYATAAARLLVQLAFSRGEVSAVVAHTLAQENASNAVLKKIGMSLVAELPNPEVGKVWKWGVRRSTPMPDAVKTPIAILDEAQCQELEAFLVDRIYEFNSQATGYFDGRLLGASIRNEAGDVIAGLSGHTWGGCGQISNLWVSQAHRGQGLGRKLMEAAEVQALRRGCSQMVVITHSFQAPAFYDRLGYQRRHVIEDLPKGHSDIVFVKPLKGSHDA